MRFIIEHSVTGERRVLLRRGSFKAPWRVVGVEPKVKVRGNDTLPIDDPVLPDLAIVERARAKYGKNTSLKALAELIKARGL